MSNYIEQTKALASEARLTIMQWLKNPELHFNHQQTGKPDEIGVCVTLIAEKLNMSQPTVSRHLDILKRSKLVTVQRVGKWSFFSRNETELAKYLEQLRNEL